MYTVFRGTGEDRVEVGTLDGGPTEVSLFMAKLNEATGHTYSAEEIDPPEPEKKDVASLEAEVFGTVAKAQARK